MFCKHCGKQVSRESKFCRYCGKELLIEEPSVATTIEAPIHSYDRGSKGNAILEASLEVLVTILIFINFFSGIVGGLWLAFTGGLSLVLFGIFLSIVMPFAYSIAILPQIGLAALLTKLIDGNNRIVVTILGFIASVYGNIVLSVWTIFVFENLVQSQAQYIFPLLLWGYSTVMAPLSYMASKESPDSSGTSMGLFFAQISFLLVTVLFLVGIPDTTRNLSLLVLAFLFSFVSASVVYGSMGSRQSKSVI